MPISNQVIITFCNFTALRHSPLSSSPNYDKLSWIIVQELILLFVICFEIHISWLRALNTNIFLRTVVPRALSDNRQHFYTLCTHRCSDGAHAIFTVNSLIAEFMSRSWFDCGTIMQVSLWTTYFYDIFMLFNLVCTMHIPGGPFDRARELVPKLKYECILLLNRFFFNFIFILTLLWLLEKLPLLTNWRSSGHLSNAWIPKCTIGHVWSGFMYLLVKWISTSIMAAFKSASAIRKAIQKTMR